MGYGGAMSLQLFAGLAVRDFAAARAWYEQLLGAPSFLPHATEAVGTLAEARSVHNVQDPDRAGPGLVTLLVDDLDAQEAAIRVDDGATHADDVSCT